MSVTVTLGMILWNQGALAPLTIASVMAERQRLQTAGYHANVALIDNASWDGTAVVATEAATHHGRDASCDVLEAPASATTIRNSLIDMSQGDDYVAFIDGDIEIVPHSFVAMLHYLSDSSSLSAMAFDPLSQCSDRSKMAGYCRSVAGIRRDPLMYLCGYGLFRRDIFDHLSFDESGPLGQCGWGMEDDDLWFSLVEAGYEATYAEGFSFYHPQPRSSWDSLRALGINPLTNYEARKDYVLQKWRQKRSERVAPLMRLLEAQHV